MPVSALTAVISFIGDCGDSASTRRRASEWGTKVIGVRVAGTGEVTERRRGAGAGAGVFSSSSDDSSEEDADNSSGCGGTGVPERPALAALAAPRLVSTVREPPANSSDRATSEVDARSTPSVPS